MLPLHNPVLSVPQRCMRRGALVCSVGLFAASGQGVARRRRSRNAVRQFNAHLCICTSVPTRKVRVLPSWPLLASRIPPV